MRTLMVLFVLFELLEPLAGQSPEFELQELTAFRNGTAFLEKEAIVDAATGSVQLTEYPIEALSDDEAAIKSSFPVLFGTVHWSAPGNEVLQVVSENREVLQQIPADNLYRLLQLNAGKKVCIWTKDTKAPSNCGYILGHSEEGDEKISGQLLLREGQALHQFAVQNIQRLEFEADAIYEEEAIEVEPSLRLELARAKSRQKLQLSYLQHGINWFPSYQLVLSEAGQARLTLFAHLINGIENLNKVKVNFAFSSPPLSYARRESLSFTGHAVENVLPQLSAIPGRAGTAKETEFYLPRPLPGGGEKKEAMSPALFYYQQEDVCLGQGGRGLFNLFEWESASEQLYAVEVEPAKQPPPVGEEQKQSATVWKALKFRNKGDVPLAEGKVDIFLQNQGKLRPLGESELVFTPPKEEVIVKMEVAQDILVSIVDQQPKEKRREQEPDGSTLVNVKMKLVNNKGRKALLYVRRNVNGRPLQCNIDWQVNALVDPSGSLSPVSEVAWLICLEPGEELEVNYSYEGKNG